MKIIRFVYQDQVHYGTLEGEVVQSLAAPPYDGLSKTEQYLPVAAVRFLLLASPPRLSLWGSIIGIMPKRCAWLCPRNPLSS
jgi:hypothetical protein